MTFGFRANNIKTRTPMKRLFGTFVSVFAMVFVSAPAASTTACSQFANKLPNLSSRLCAQASLQAGTARSVQGMPLFTRDVVAQGASLRVLVLGAIHGDELSAGSLAFHWLALAQDRQDMPVQLPQPVHWRFIPVLNPDGVLRQPPSRVNARGVDLNRNFPTPNWAVDAPLYWDKRTRKDPRRWPGPRALSEPESQFVVQQMEQFKPHLIVSIHAPYGVLDFDGPKSGKWVPPGKLGRLYLDQVGIFPGSLGNYGGVHKGVPVVTIELPNSMRTPLDAEMRQMWVDLMRWIAEKSSQGMGDRDLQAK
jgi:murein peptide amidase A